MNSYYKQSAYSSNKQVVNGNLVEAKDMRYVNDNGQKQLSSRFLDDDGNIKHIHIEHPLFQRLSSNKKTLKQRLIEDFNIKPIKKSTKSTKSIKSTKSTKSRKSFKKTLSYAKGITKRFGKFKRKKKTKICRTKIGRYTKCKK